MKIITSFALLFAATSILSSTSLAKSLTCELRINQKTVLNKVVNTQKRIKTLIGQFEGISTYITEKEDGLFANEGFAPQYELRFYGEGNLNSNKNKVIASIWGREILIESICAPTSVKD